MELMELIGKAACLLVAVVVLITVLFIIGALIWDACNGDIPDGH